MDLASSIPFSLMEDGVSFYMFFFKNFQIEFLSSSSSFTFFFLGLLKGWLGLIACQVHYFTNFMFCRTHALHGEC